MVSRFNLNYHTVEQIGWGFCIGSGVALFVILNTKKMFPVLLESDDSSQLDSLSENLEKVQSMNEEVKKTQAQVRAVLRKIEKAQKRE